MAVVDPLVVTDNTVFRENIKERQRSLDCEDDISSLTQVSSYTKFLGVCSFDS